MLRARWIALLTLPVTMACAPLLMGQRSNRAIITALVSDPSGAALPVWCSGVREASRAPMPASLPSSLFFTKTLVKNTIRPAAAGSRLHRCALGLLGCVLISMKVVSDSDLIPVSGSDPVTAVVGAKRRWRH
jgi:hypothetical protein